jgi:hypothetical protein
VDVSGDAIYERVQRSPETVRRAAGPPGRSFADVMIAVMEEIET